jgi:hypothetical protein
MGFEPTIPVFQQAKTIYALDRAVTVIGHLKSTYKKARWTQGWRPCSVKKSYSCEIQRSKNASEMV